MMPAPRISMARGPALPSSDRDPQAHTSSKLPQQDLKSTSYQPYTTLSTSPYDTMADHTPTQDQIEEGYHPKDAIGGAVKATAVTAAAGVFISTIQNTLTRHNVGAMGAFTRFGG